MSVAIVVPVADGVMVLLGTVLSTFPSGATMWNGGCRVVRKTGVISMCLSELSN